MRLLLLDVFGLEQAKFLVFLFFMPVVHIVSVAAYAVLYDVDYFSFKSSCARQFHHSVV